MKKESLYMENNQKKRMDFVYKYGWSFLLNRVEGKPILPEYS